MCLSYTIQCLEIHIYRMNKLTELANTLPHAFVISPHILFLPEYSFLSH